VATLGRVSCPFLPAYAKVSRLLHLGQYPVLAIPRDPPGSPFSRDASELRFPVSPLARRYHFLSAVRLYEDRLILIGNWLLLPRSNPCNFFCGALSSFSVLHPFLSLSLVTKLRFDSPTRTILARGCESSGPLSLSSMPLARLPSVFLSFLPRSFLGVRSAPKIPPLCYSSLTS